MQQIVPLDNSPNQSFDITLNVNDKNITLSLFLSFNSMAGYWTLNISQNGASLVAGLPLVYGENILDGLEYLQIGSAYIAKMSDNLAEIPDTTNLGTDFVLIWGDYEPTT